MYKWNYEYLPSVERTEAAVDGVSRQQWLSKE